MTIEEKEKEKRRLWELGWIEIEDRNTYLHYRLRGAPCKEPCQHYECKYVRDYDNRRTD